MKKSISLALGLALITAAIIPFSSASRSAYHAYITSQQNRDDYRFFSEGRRSINETDEETVVLDYADFSYSNPAYAARFQRNSRENFDSAAGATRVSATNTTYVETTSRTKVDSQIRPFATRAGIAPWRSQLRSTGRMTRTIAAPFQENVFDYETFENDAFSVRLPLTAQAQTDDAHAFTIGEIDLRIKKFAKNTCDNAFGFRGCATNITKSENAALVGGKGRLISLDRVVRQTYESDTVLGEVNLQTEVYTEEFTTEFPDGLQYTLYRYAVQDIDGGVYFIEVKIPRAQARQYVGMVDTIFDSFRMYPAN